MDNFSLWQKYKKNNDINAKHCLVEEYVELVKIVAGRLSTTYGNTVEYEDLVSYGIFGLLDAIEKFELEKNVKFETYAQIRIRGAIVDHLRNLDWIPRSIRQKVKAVEAAYRKLENSLGRSATDREVSIELGMTIKEFHSILQQISNLNIVSLEEQLSEGNFKSISDEVENLPENIVCGDEIKEILKDTIEQLPERERQVISLYYYDELTYREIGVVLNISESRVSQLHSKAISRLKGKLI
ncbi:FliA/WhiG family RNA polymerase sigma factor [Alkaliphilus peptidifermentans]|uniref:RNA polymerase sigma factor n=1 Tax=Alkaliphilus peptidifermentans DSM 18978 TaxID=1120976 RepID=A0A1G5DFF2_9FIRM|nr:FliA/WhiG family RNA polymerase sigma factor [Alkaliphilus peptidifermentans]SCY13277.1 RNA polymerase, sigma 28 subunit, SigD/FliA/WhiG [Alkaliphilus peptidifermentans DSM 18978]